MVCELNDGCELGETFSGASYLQEAAGVVLLDDLHAVLHQPRGLTQLHRAVGDLIPHHLGTNGGILEIRKPSESGADLMFPEGTFVLFFSSESSDWFRLELLDEDGSQRLEILPIHLPRSVDASMTQ